ncbi:ATP-dependent DNA helicase pif1 [Fusarium oxysporum f. sp. albedinis]|nr:ATP-dependent DNA helicase pif1 [Fusarium oxysporum f. sp. albedinis]
MNIPNPPAFHAGSQLVLPLVPPSTHLSAPMPKKENSPMRLSPSITAQVFCTAVDLLTSSQAQFIQFSSSSHWEFEL